MPDFMKIVQLVQKLKRTNTHRQHHLLEQVNGIFHLLCRSVVPKLFDMTLPPLIFIPNHHAPMPVTTTRMQLIRSWQYFTSTVWMFSLICLHKYKSGGFSSYMGARQMTSIANPCLRNGCSTTCLAWKVRRGTIMLKLHALMNVTRYILQYKGSSTSG